MNRRPIVNITSALAGVLLLGMMTGCMQESGENRRPHYTLFIGVDASGSFKNSGYYDNALSFLAHYIYGHLSHKLGLGR